MPDPNRLPVVATINSTPDVVDMLRLAFETEGFVVLSTYTHMIRDGEVDIEAGRNGMGGRVGVRMFWSSSTAPRRG